MRKSKKLRKIAKLRFETQVREALKEYVKLEGVKKLLNDEVIETPNLDKWFEDFCAEIENNSKQK